MEQEIIKLEQVCTAMYETGDANVREHAQKILVDLVDDVQVLQKCQLLFQRSALPITKLNQIFEFIRKSPYALLIAASTLTKKVTKGSSTLSIQEKLDIRNFVLNYLYTENKLQSFVEEELTLLYARISKVSWLDSSKDGYYFRDVMQDITKFLQNNERCILGIHLLNQLVTDMDRLDNVKPMTRHRKIVAGFRDKTLLEIFQIACQMIPQLVSGKQFQGNEDCTLLSAVLRLTLACLTFDFMGTNHDQSGDDLGTVQIPTSWHASFMELNLPQLFFNLYDILPYSLSSVVMCSLVQIVSVRRSLFDVAERDEFLNNLIKGVTGVLKNPQKLSDEATFHEFCRLLARLKANYQLGELVKARNYPECIALIADFTATSLRLWHFSPNSIHYLLSLWQRMSTSVPYMKAQEPHFLDKYMPEILKSYLESRLSLTEAVIRDGLENPLDDVACLKQQLEQISAIARCEYRNTCELLVRSFDDVASQLEKALQSSVNGNPLLILFGKLTWIIHMVGAVIGGRVSFSATDDHDSMDGQLVIRVLQLMQLTDGRLASGDGYACIELAFLTFFEHFRKIYIGEQVQKNCKVYKRLSESLQINDDSAVLTIFVNKMITNFKYWSNNHLILKSTLKLLTDLTMGFSSVRKLVRLESVRFILENDPAKHFPFLANDSKIEDLQCRSSFFTSIGRLLMIDIVTEEEERFLRFTAPMNITFQSLQGFLESANSGNANHQAARTLIGVTRDCRGLTYAFNSKKSYAMLFKLVYPNFVNLLQKAIKLWPGEPEITSPILKFFGELVLNRGQRLNFDVSSPNGILLFREASKVVCSYGTGILEFGEPPKDKLYSHRIKGITLSFILLKNALCGGYVNFGVFRLYNDPTLEDALNIFIKLVMALQSNHLIDFPKLCEAYFSLLEVTMQDHMIFYASLPAAVIYHVLETITEGLDNHNTGVSTSCCMALDYFVSFTFLTANPSHGYLDEQPHCPYDVMVAQRKSHLLQVMQDRPTILHKALNLIFRAVLFEECRNSWSMSRPLLGLMLLHPDYVDELKKSLCNPTSEHGALNIEQVSQVFNQVMTGVDKTLRSKSRDRFSQNLSAFRRGFDEILRNDYAKRWDGCSDTLDLTINTSRMMT